MKITQDHVEGARQVIQRGLGLQPGQNLLIIADETTYQVAALLSDAAIEYRRVGDDRLHSPWNSKNASRRIMN